MNPQIKELTAIINQEIKNESAYKYATPLKNSNLYKIYIANIEEGLASSSIDGVYFSWLLDLSILHFEYSVFALNKLKDTDLAKKHLSLSSEYGYKCLDAGASSCGCFECKNPFVIVNKATFMLSNLLLASDTKKFVNVADHLIDSLNGEGCIIKKGYKNSSISWFILKLYSAFYSKEIILHKLLQAKLEFPYDEIVENFDTTDVNEVSKYIALLCDMHLISAKESYEIHYKEQYGEDDESDIYGLKYKELFSIGTYLLPFEALLYLKLRELHGLKNPTEFTHELMSSDLVKMYLDIKEPLEEPTELPYANELIEKVKENCKKFEIDKPTKSKEQIQTPPPKALAPKTGKYRATLPSEHPQAKQLESDPHSYARFKKDDTFTYKGLEDYDLSEITWSYVGN